MTMVEEIMEEVMTVVVETFKRCLAIIYEITSLSFVVELCGYGQMRVVE